MAVQLTLTDISSGYQGSDIQANFTAIEDEFDKVLYRDGSLTVTDTIDMNSQRLVNLPNAIDNSDAATLSDVLSQTTEDATSKPATAITVDDSAGYFIGSNLEFVLIELGSFKTGITASAAELNVLDGATVSTAEINTLDGVTASTAELNTLDGITATTSELNSATSIDNSYSKVDLTNSGADDTSTFDFTGIPSTAKRITILFLEASRDAVAANDGIAIQIGPSGGFETSGYVSTSAVFRDDDTNTVNASVRSDSFVLVNLTTNSKLTGSCVLNNIGGNQWVMSQALASDGGTSSTTGAISGGGHKTLAGSLERIRITANVASGGSVFTNGDVTIIVE